MEKSDLQEIANELEFRPILLKEQLQEPRARTVEGFVILIESEESPFVKDRYARDMVNLIKKNRKMREYKIGIRYLAELNKRSLMFDLANDMVYMHPIAGRIARFMSPFCIQPKEENY